MSNLTQNKRDGSKNCFSRSWQSYNPLISPEHFHHIFSDTISDSQRPTDVLPELCRADETSMADSRARRGMFHMPLPSVSTRKGDDANPSDGQRQSFRSFALQGIDLKREKSLGRTTGIEPATTGTTNRRSTN